MEADISSLMSRISFWETWGYVALGAVLVGVAGESIKEFTHWLERIGWEKRISRLSALILIAGLAGEGITQPNSNAASATLIAYLNNQSAQTRRQNLELEQAVSPRYLDDSAIVKVLKEHPGQTVQLDVAPDFEARRLAGGLAQAFRNAGWEIKPPENDSSTPMDGVHVMYVGPPIGFNAWPDEATQKRDRAAKALVAELKRENITAIRWATPPGPVLDERMKSAGILADAIRVRVGLKPQTYFLEQRYPWIREQRERSEQMEADFKRRYEEHKKKADEILKGFGMPPLPDEPDRP
jgi:hypothetical protein